MSTNEKQRLLKLLVTILLAEGKPIPPELKPIAEEIERERASWVGETIRQKQH